MNRAPFDPMLPRLFRVQRVQPEIPLTTTIDLVPVSGEIPPFAAGQFNMIYAFGTGEIPLSISGDPGDGTLLRHTTRAVGGTSRAICALTVGDIVGVRGPFGTAWPLAHAVGRDVVLVAGGIGLAPLRPVLYHIVAQRTRYRRVSLLYGARTPGDLLFQSEIATWQRAGIEVAITVDQATTSWQGHIGVVTKLLPLARFDPATAVALICGPEIMMRFAALGCEQHGIAPEQTFVSLERNMQCAIGLCGHCQYSAWFVCKDGPVFPYQRVKGLLQEHEI
jgi:NAD(P)H-flavin reductase